MKEFLKVGVIAGCVINQDDKYLLVQEKIPKVYGKWNLPAGHVDVGESIEQAAVREAFEETGYKVELKKEIRVEHSSAQTPVLHAFTTKIVGGEQTVNPDEVLDVKWFSKEEILQLEKQGDLRDSWVVHAIEDAEDS